MANLITISATANTNQLTITRTQSVGFESWGYPDSIKVTPIFNDSTIDKGYVITKLPVES